MRGRKRCATSNRFRCHATPIIIIHEMFETTELFTQNVHEPISFERFTIVSILDASDSARNRVRIALE